MNDMVSSPPGAYRAPLRERLAIAWDRAQRWEFWPAWLFYLPVLGYVAWLALRFRRPTVFTAANPLMAAGGFVGDSKSVPLALLLRNHPDCVAEFELIPAAAAPARRLAQAEQAVARLGGYPVVLKPDVGQRGRGVAVVRDAGQLQAGLLRGAQDMLVQRYIAGQEYGVFVYRDPAHGAAVVYSVTHKCFPQVQGDGRRTLAELIAANARARLIAPLLWQRFAARLHEILPADEAFPLVEIGAHCRGSLFLDARLLITPALQQAIERVLAAMPGYHFGRLDLRCPSAEHLARGEGLRILEVNGVTAEAAHIYHPGTPLREGYASILRQWEIAYRIGAANARAGAQVASPAELLRRWRADQRLGGCWD